MTGVMYLTAIRTASMAASKQSDGVHGGHDRARGLAVAAVHGLEQVGLLGLGGQAGGRAAALHVDDDAAAARGMTARPMASDLRSMPGPAGGGDAERPAEGGADGGADAGDLVLGLEGADAEVLVLGQLVQDVGGRRDRDSCRGRAGSSASVAGGDQAPGQGRVAGDVACRCRAASLAGGTW